MAATQQTMGCNTSRGATVTDPSEKPEERPKTSTSTQETSAEESTEAADKEKADILTVAAEFHQVLKS